eukprot:TRINITY_DN15982_c0_g1_i4.p1 TRINITY_DN15982_c0_g1~~TRINITY_DN15982_c0_g1_i4.p1  ORF type:complete len:135 (+),score=25.31 TRINITY_DN15982_c0_g1_i4:511-915(+)
MSGPRRRSVSSLPVGGQWPSSTQTWPQAVHSPRFIILAKPSCGFAPEQLKMYVPIAFSSPHSSQMRSKASERRSQVHAFKAAAVSSSLTVPPGKDSGGRATNATAVSCRAVSCCRRSLERTLLGPLLRPLLFRV